MDLQAGRVKDRGSTGHEGDVISVVQDTQGLDFQEALQWIAEEVGLDPDSLWQGGEEAVLVCNADWEHSAAALRFWRGGQRPYSS